MKRAEQLALWGKPTPEINSLALLAKRPKSGNYNLGDFAKRPDGKQPHFNKQASTLIPAGITSDIVVLTDLTVTFKFVGINCPYKF
ncbi:hypothetical protein A4H97_27945 [Niastella yeongjuensis]|uniref:Uncharacterized protein n=1 Tax=Niastella yeongjuensis TaxID=354355 RepID=A0A1V9EU80_9BACT|nr:hypothetical protein [Niastella yeongjuensis]OQP49727.1 hypothetical protein A4H97_27945 [Niastella yeongjuensis]SEP40811.1 hypothetical protein SAMN05660816_05846 [Niastella yeongjuensis]